MITSITLTVAAITFAVNILTSLLKGFVYPKFGKLGVQVVAFVLAAIGAWYFIYGQHIASLASFVVAALAIFSLSVTFYEVILQHLPWFKGDAK